MIDFVIHSYNQLLDNIKNIIQNYDFHYKLGKNVDVSFTIKDVVYENTEIQSYIQAVRQRQQNFSTKAKILMSIDFTTENKTKSLDIDTFYIELPIMTNSYLDPILKMSPYQRYIQGSDTTQPGGDIVFNGVPYLVQNTFQYPMNKPVYAESDQYPCVAYANYLYQANVMFGNSYYTRYDLLVKDDSYDIAIHFKQTDPQTKIGYIPFMLLFKAFGCKTDKEALEYCNPNNDKQLNYFLINIIRNGYLHKEYYKSSKITQDEAYKLIFNCIASKQAKSVDIIPKILSKYISDNPQAYLYTIGEIIRGLYYSYMNNQYSNRDGLHNKRVFTISTQVLSQLRGSIRQGFMQAMYSLSKTISTLQQVDTHVEDIKNTIQDMSRIVSSTLTKSFVNSNFDTVAPLQKTLNEQKTLIFDIMQKRQIAIRSASMQGEVSQRQRMLQQDYYGFICPIQTPESGASTGKYDSPNIYSYVSIAKQPTEIIDFIQHHKLYLKSYKKYSMPIKVNYTTIGFVLWKDFKKLYEDLLEFRQQNALLKEPMWEQDYDLTYYKKNTITIRQNQLMTSIYYSIEQQELCINTDSGRIMTPILKGSYTKGTSIERLIKLGRLQYIDCDMLQNFIITEWDENSNTRWRYLPQGLIGDFPAASPMCGTLKSIRALYSTSQMKQNISLPYTNPNIQMTNQQLTIIHPQEPVVDTSFNRIMYSPKPSMQLVFLVFKSATFNQEDALVANGGYFARNGGSSNSYKTYTSQLEADEEFDKIKLQVGQNINKNDTLITKNNNVTQTQFTVKYQEAYPTKYTQISNIVVNDKEALIQTNLTRFPTEGDKFISRNAQKGTIGKIYKEYELPILENGIIPTFIQNPDSVLRRETYGQIIEPCMGRYLAENKELITNYGHDEYDLQLLKELSKMKQYKCVQNEDYYLLGGPMMYAAQKHLVAQKIYAVNNAVLSKATRQPAAGRRRHGGIRLGNMEQSAIYAQGCAQIIKDMNGANSSNINWYICKRCGTNHVYPINYTAENLQQYKYYCQFCGYTNDVQINGFSYQQSLLQEILSSIGLQLQYKTDDFDKQK